MGTVTNLHEDSQGKSSCDIGTNKAGFHFVVVQAPESIGSKYAIFGAESEEELKDVTVNDLLFQLNGIFLQESNNFFMIHKATSTMVNFCYRYGIKDNDTIYEQDGKFKEKVYELLTEQVPECMDTIYSIVPGQLH